MIARNDTSYVSFLVLEFIGIFVEFIEILKGTTFAIWLKCITYFIAIVLPLVIIMLEKNNKYLLEYIYVCLAKIYKLFNQSKSKKMLLKLVTKYPECYIGHKMLAEIYVKEGGRRKAIDEYVQVLDIKKDDTDSYYKISVLLRELGRNDEATEMLRTLLKTKPDMYEASKLLGGIYLEQKEFKKAIEVYTNAVKYNANNYELYYNLGVCYSRINDFDIARKCFQKTIELDEEMYLAYYRLGQLALLYRDFDVAEESFAKSLCNEKEAKAYFELAKIHIIKNQKEKAILDINNAIRKNSKYYEIAKKEPLFPIKNMIEKPIKESEQEEFTENQQELEIEEYLNDTYNLTKVLNKQKEKKNK